MIKDALPTTKFTQTQTRIPCEQHHTPNDEQQDAYSQINKKEGVNKRSFLFAVGGCAVLLLLALSINHSKTNPLSPLSDNQLAWEKNVGNVGNEDENNDIRGRRLGRPAPSPVSTEPLNTMVPVVWDANNEATIEFCEDGNGGFGYRNVADAPDCYPAGILIRMDPGEHYILTLQNSASETTNIHTHGLHISGAGNADDVTREVSPNKCLKYYWNIPADHMGGTFWMHAHHHGSTNSQVSSGAFAMLIINENTDVLSHVDATSQANIQKWMDNELLLVASNTDTVRGNGRLDLTYDLIQDEWYRLRVVAVDGSSSRNTLEIPSSCMAHAVAYDGVWRRQVPKLEESSYYSLSGANRLDVALKCTQVTTGSSLSIDFGNRPVAYISVTAGTTSGATPYDPTNAVDKTWSSFRPNYLSDLSGLTIVNATYTLRMSGGKIGDYQYQDETTPALMDVNYGTLHEWTIGGTKSHPFHLHVYHMQVVSCLGYETGEYVDTVSATSGDCIVRFPVIDIGERVTLHCHNLQHEDNGAMSWLNVVGDLPFVQSTVDRDEVTCAR